MNLNILKKLNISPENVHHDEDMGLTQIFLNDEDFLLFEESTEKQDKMPWVKSVRKSKNQVVIKSTWTTKIIRK